MWVSSPSGELDGVVVGAKPFRHALAMVALDLDAVVVLDGAAGAAEALQLPRDSLPGGPALAQSADDRDHLAAAAAPVAEEAYHAVVGNARGRRGRRGRRRG